MSVEIEEQFTMEAIEGSSSSTELSNWKPKYSYTREFLLSLGELEVCKKLPKGFDESLLSEFSESSYGPQDRPRVPGSSSLQGFRRTEYGSSPPTRGDSSTYSRGLNRWDSRSSVRSEGDSDSDSGRRYGSQTRRSWQNPEHDGLLGSGSFPRPPGYAAGAAVPRFRSNENIQLNKSNEPYHPPRPYKAIPHTRREITDSLNDETFGSDDCTNEDRAEEEKKRRAEFELMRKEHHKAYQDKQKLNLDKPKDSFSEMVGLLENPKDSKISSNLDKVVKQTPHEDISKLPASSQAPPIRPLVPPGFVSSVVDKSSTVKPIVHADILQVGNLEPKDVHQNVNSLAQGRGSSDLHHEMGISSDIKVQKGPDLSSVLLGVDQARASILPEVNEVFENAQNLGLDSEIMGHKVLGEPVRSTSLLDTLFGNSSTASSGSTSNLVESHHSKTDDMWSPETLDSKFAHWFLEEDHKPVGNMSSKKPNNLLSLIGGGEKAGSDVSDVVATRPIFSSEAILGQKSSKPVSSIAEMTEKISSSNAQELKPSVLTCEDLEQSILLEVGGDIPRTLPPENKQNAVEMKNRQPGIGVDNLASQHLLSLLQRGMGPDNAASISGPEERSLDKPCDNEVGKLGWLDSNSKNAGTDGSYNSENTLTLESLFGTAFMKELHSAQKKSVGSARMDVSDGTPFPSKMSENGNGNDSQEGSILASNEGITKLDKVADWLGFQEGGKEVDFSRLPAEVGSRFSGFDGGFGVKLPEEDSLINLIDPINAENLVPSSRSYNADSLSLSSNTNVIEKLAALGGAIKDERSMAGIRDPVLLRGHYDMMKPEFPYQNLHPHASSAQLHVPPMNDGRPLFHPSDPHPTHLDPHLKFMPPEAVIHRDAPNHHQFPANMGHHSFPHPSAGLPGFDHPIPPPVLQQMQMSGNLPPPHLMRGFPGAAAMPPHPSHNPAGFIPEQNPMQGFPFGQRQPNFGGHGMAPPGPELGAANNPPEAFQRLVEMELRANPKQMHPFAGGGPSRAMYGHELDTGFRYR